MSTTFTRTDTVPIILQAQGAIVALDEVDIRPSKSGTLSRIHFSEGDDLRRGQLLFTLDDRDDAANVQRNEANVASARASLQAARRDFERAQDLSARNFLSPAALDAARSKLETAEAALAQNQAALEQAKVQLSYTRIRAPQDGRAGRVDVRPGSVVATGGTAPGLVKITRMDPIGASFSLPERELSALLTAQKQGGARVTVDLDGRTPINGRVVFIDSSVDRVSGTIAVKARLDNRARRVWPGQFVTVKVVAGEILNAVVLPAQAVINGPNGRLVYRVLPDNTVQSQPVELVRVHEQKAVLKGIEAGVKVVLEGAQNLRPGGRIVEVNGGGREGGRRGRRNGGDASAPVAGETAAGPVPSASAPAAALPEGFTPRDPEAWAKLSDDEKRERIQRWRERRAAQGAGAQ